MRSCPHVLFLSCCASMAIAAEPAPVGLRGQITSDLTRPAQPGAVVLSYADVAARTLPGVVTVIAIKFVSEPSDADAATRLDLGRNDANSHVPQEVKGNGSGVIITRAGHVLTNAHVVAHMDILRVRIPERDGELPARVIGTDPLTDVALLKIEADHLAPLTMGDSAALRTGDVVLALGSPFGLEQTVTLGIVSATGRSLNFIRNGYEDFIQTDASINPGNSGGALVDGLGRLVGINSARYPDGLGGSTGIGFAIPTNLALRIADDLLVHGHVRRGFLGVRMAALSEAQTRALLGRDGQRPAQITEIDAGGPADKAGFKMNDIVTGMNGKPMPSLARLRQAIAMLEPNARAVFQVVRGTDKVELTAELAEAPQGPVTAGSYQNKVDNSPASPLLGLTAVTLSDEGRHEWQIPSAIKGVLIVNVGQELAGRLKPGDVITAVNATPVVRMAELVRALQAAPARSAMLRLWRAGEEAFSAHTVPRTEPVPGVVLGELDEAARREWKIPPGVKGALVLKAEPVEGKPVGKFRAGVVILTINGKAATDLSVVDDTFQAAVPGQIMFRLWTPEGETLSAVTKKK